MKPPTVVKLTNQPKTVFAPLETVIKVKRENKAYPSTSSVDDPQCPNIDETHTESDSNQWKPGLRNSAEDLGGLTTDRHAVQDARGGVQETVTSGECTGKDCGVNDVGEDLDSSAIHSDDVWAAREGW